VEKGVERNKCDQAHGPRHQIPSGPSAIDDGGDGAEGYQGADEGGLHQNETPPGRASPRPGVAVVVEGAHQVAAFLAGAIAHRFLPSTVSLKGGSGPSEKTASTGSAKKRAMRRARASDGLYSPRSM